MLNTPEKLERAHKRWMNCVIGTPESISARQLLDEASIQHEALTIYKNWSRHLRDGNSNLASYYEKKLSVLRSKYPLLVDLVFED